MKKKALSAIGITFGIIILGISYYYYISSPKYSINQILKTYKEHDVTQFNKYVDTKSLIGFFIDEKFNSSDDSNFERGLTALAKPRIEEIFVTELNKLIETGEVDIDKKTKNPFENYWLGNKTPIEFNKISRVDKDGKIATIGLEFNLPNYDTTLILDVKMRDKGSYWQLFDIKDINNFNEGIEVLEEKRIEELNEKVISKFYENIEIKNIKVQSKPWRGYKNSSYYDNTYSLEFVNIGGNRIKNISFDLILRDAEFNRIKNLYKHKLDINLNPGDTYTYKVIDDFSRDNIGKTKTEATVTVETCGFELDIEEPKFEDYVSVSELSSTKNESNIIELSFDFKNIGNKNISEISFSYNIMDTKDSLDFFSEEHVIAELKDYSLNVNLEPGEKYTYTKSLKISSKFADNKKFYFGYMYNTVELLGNKVEWFYKWR